MDVEVEVAMLAVKKLGLPPAEAAVFAAAARNIAMEGVVSPGANAGSAGLCEPWLSAAIAASRSGDWCHSLENIAQLVREAGEHLCEGPEPLRQEAGAVC